MNKTQHTRFLNAMYTHFNLKKKKVHSCIHVWTKITMPHSNILPQNPHKPVSLMPVSKECPKHILNPNGWQRNFLPDNPHGTQLKSPHVHKPKVLSFMAASLTYAVVNNVAHRMLSFPELSNVYFYHNVYSTVPFNIWK